MIIWVRLSSSILPSKFPSKDNHRNRLEGDSSAKGNMELGDRAETLGPEVYRSHRRTQGFCVEREAIVMRERLLQYSENMYTRLIDVF